MRDYPKTLTMAIAALSLFLAACSGGGAATSPSPTTGTSAPTSVPTVAATPIAATVAAPTTAATTAATSAPASPTAAPTTASSAAPAATAATNATPAAQPAAASDGLIHYSVVPSDTKADFRVREQLARLSFPSDAVGTTTSVTGTLVLDATGKPNQDLSKFVVDMNSFHSDSGMRDGYIRRSTLDTAKYPTAVFVPTAFQGLPAPLPATGQQTFQLLGNLTVHGVTKPVTWNVTSQVNGNDVTGQATTNFKFEDFGMSPPQTAAVLSVTDDVKLELSFHLAKSA